MFLEGLEDDAYDLTGTLIIHSDGDLKVEMSEGVLKGKAVKDMTIKEALGNHILDMTYDEIKEAIRKRKEAEKPPGKPDDKKPLQDGETYIV